MRRSALFGLYFLLILTGLSAPASAKRVALVIGIDDYTAVGDLDKAVSDAELMRDTLAGLGFDVVFAKNIDRLQFLEEIDRFKEKLRGSASGTPDAFIFFAGHGVSFKGANLLLPADARPGSESVVQGSAIAETDLIEAAREGGAKLTVLVLDACRNNPIEEEKRKLAAATGDKFRFMDGMRIAGLSAKPTSGVFSIYSAGHGQVASDGGKTDRNSLFTAIFARELASSRLHLSDMMEDVKEEVSKLAGNFTNPDTGLPHIQSPAFYNETLGGRIFLRPGAPSVAAPAPQPDNAVEVAFWNSVQNSDSAEAVQEYLSRFPNGAFAGLARIRLKALEQKQAALPPASPGIAQEGNWRTSVRQGDPAMVGIEAVAKDGKTTLSGGCNTGLGRGFSGTLYSYKGDSLSRIDDQSEPIVFEIADGRGGQTSFDGRMHYFAPDEAWVTTDLLPVAFLNSLARGETLSIRSGKGETAVEFGLAGAEEAVETMRRVCGLG